MSFAILTALTAREFGEVIITTVLRDTPIEVTIIVLLVLTALSTRRNIVKFSYIHLFYLPFLLGPALGIILTSLQNADVLNLEPVIGNHHTNIMGGLLDIAALFQSSFIITLIIPFMMKPEKAMKASIWAMIIAGMLYLLIVISTIATFGPQETIRLIWPTLENARTASIPGGFLERLDVIFLIVWLISVFTTMFTTYYLTCYTTQELFHFKDHGLFSTFLLPFVFVFAICPHDIFQFFQIAQWTGRIGFFLTLCYPILLWVIAVIRKKRERTCEE
nr:endospore germination permease [Paenibacillus antarcticus]